ncbi:hypothetical protein ACFYTC_42145 [Actinomadura nitritigenes]|uniref:hypothetical protein n=1 Tax=Actinomadura nitritigenes TaxID=134602 RepID=UPI0036CBFE74
MSGEETQAKGADGARRAKLWLDATTRVNVRWVNPEKHAVRKLTFEWADGSEPFSFDLGGILLGEDLEGQEFFAECKKYANAYDQGKHYRKYLAQCYRALHLRPERCDNFMWITWAPFDVTVWEELLSAKRVRQAVLEHSAKVLNEPRKEQAESLVSEEMCEDVSDRLWMIVLSDRQERLTLTREHLAVIRHHDTIEGRL